VTTSLSKQTRKLVEREREAVVERLGALRGQSKRLHSLTEAIDRDVEETARLRRGIDEMLGTAPQRGLAVDALDEDMWRLALEAEGAWAARSDRGTLRPLRELLRERLALEPTKDTRGFTFASSVRADRLQGPVAEIELTSNPMPSDLGPILKFMSGARRTWGRPVRVRDGRWPLKSRSRDVLTRFAFDRRHLPRLRAMSGPHVVCAVHKHRTAARERQL
jgi:hypothetical protein